MAHVNIDEKIANIKFDEGSLNSSFAQDGRSVPPDFLSAMRGSLRQYAKAYGDLLLCLASRNGISIKEIYGYCIDGLRTKLSPLRKAFELVGQQRAVLDVEVAVASNYIMGRPV